MKVYMEIVLQFGGGANQLYGDCSDLKGDVSGLVGRVTGIYGGATGIAGDLDACEITYEERNKGVEIYKLIK